MTYTDFCKQLRTTLAESDVTLSKDETRLVLDTFSALLLDTVNQEGKVVIKDLGIFKKVERKGRTGRNPQTGEPIEIPAKTVITFKQSK